MTDLEINEAFGKPMYEADPTNARYNSLQLQCYEQRKEIDRLNEHITELENRLRALWDKYYGDLNHHMGRIKRLEEAGDELVWAFCPASVSMMTERESDALKLWNKAKEAKP